MMIQDDTNATNSPRITRRNLLGRSGLAAAIGASAATATHASAQAPESPVPQRTVRPRRPLGANDRINVAVVGAGSRGGSLIRELLAKSQKNPKLAVTTVCEIYKRRADAALRRLRSVATGKDFDGVLYHEYERMLDQADCDAVVVATPDHWHGKIACDAVEAGKDVYVEKPMCHTIEQARELRDLALRAGAVVQVGAQSASDPQYHRAREMIKKGAIGKVVWVRSSCNRNIPGGDWNYPMTPDCTPETLDWDRFLGLKYGLAPKRPFDRERFFRFRKYWDYSGGIATDLMFHVLTHLCVALDGGSFPRRVTASGGNWVAKDRDVPDTFMMNADYPEDYSIFIVGTCDNSTQIGEVFHGQYGSMVFGGPRLEPQEPFKAQFEQAQKAGAHDVPLPRLADHMGNFLECMRTRAKPNGNVEQAYKVQVAISMAVMAFRQGRAMTFNPQTHRASPM